MRRVTVLILMGLVSAPLSIGATVLIPIEFRELVTTAPVIVHGRVIGVRAEWIEGRRSIETFVTVEASDYLKGNLGDRLVVRVPGGQVGRYRTVFVGAPAFQEGDEVVLFLRLADGSAPWIVGLSQGAFRVVADAMSGRRIVTSPVVMSKPGDAPEAIVRGDVRRRPLDIDSFRALVRQAIEQGPRQ
jgi:hypothetical protein